MEDLVETAAFFLLPSMVVGIIAGGAVSKNAKKRIAASEAHKTATA